MKLETEISSPNEGVIMSDAENLKVILRLIDTNRLLDKIDEFRKLDLRTVSDRELSNSIFNTLCIEFENAKMSLTFHNLRIIPKGTSLFRIRTLADDDVEFPLKSMSKKSDAWYPPKATTKLGRLNKAGESVLYVSLNPYTAIKEMKIKEGDRFSLILYETKRDLKAVLIGLSKDYESYALTPEEMVKARILDNFLYYEFSRDVGKGTEFLYRASEYIANMFFEPSPPDEDDVWMYPSVVSKQEYNLCFRPLVAKQLLKLRGVVIGSYKQDKILSSYIAHSFDKNGIFNYYPVGSDVQKKIFPELIMIDE